MAHFAQLNENNVVLNVITVADSDTQDSNGVEVESIGVAFCEQNFGGRWIKTSYNNNFRRRYAHIGGTYDPVHDCFIDVKTYPSWVLDANFNWVPPVPYPQDCNFYAWDEPTRSWNLLIDNSNEPDNPCKDRRPPSGNMGVTII